MSRLILDPPRIQCPKCGEDCFYVKLRVSGYIHENHTLELGDLADNSAMWDSMRHSGGETGYCSSCNTTLGKVIGEVPDLFRSNDVIRRIVPIVTLILVHEGRMLLVKKRGQDFLILPGGKPEPGEKEVTTLRREILEELGCRIVRPKWLGVVRDAAGGEPGVQVEVTMYAAELIGDPIPKAEIEELHWTDMRNPHIPVAPSLRNLIFPYMILKQAHDGKKRKGR